MRRGKPYDIALIGLGCRFPGAPDLFSFWANILANRDCTREVPADRWPLSTFHDPEPETNDRVGGRRGGYLDAPIVFDAAAHGIMPLAVAGGEPEQFLVLEAAHAALADAGLDAGALAGLRVDAVIGRGNYFNRGNLLRLQHGRIVAQTVGLLAALHPEWTSEELDLLRRDLKASLPPFEAATIPGQLTNATAGRLADRLDLKGANFVVDAASASSLAALELSCRSLLDRRADLAIAGGVYLEADVDFPLVFQQLRALSRSGESRPFSADADGLIPGEGVGVVVLERLCDAERAGRRIYAVLEGVGLASDGRGQGLAAPSARGHARAIRRAYRVAGIEPSTVGLVEGHGLGLPAADRAELRALRAVFPPGRHGARVLGAVSSQIGHAMPAAGVAGLIKTALSLHHRVLPPTRYADRPNPLLEGSGFELVASPRPWIQGDPRTPRRAGVDAFGFAGINGHAILREHPASADGMTPGAMLDWDSEAFLLAAPDRSVLADRVRQLRDRLEGGNVPRLRDLAFTLNTDHLGLAGRARLGIVAGSSEELIQRLRAIEPRLRDPSCRQVRDARGLYFWEQPLGVAGSLAFLFPGEGSQYPGMLADLCPHFPELRAVLDKADRIAFESGEEVPPSRHLFAPADPSSEALWATDTAVTAVLSSQWALFQVLTRLGLQPDAVAGHSSGELQALAAAGVISTESEHERQLARLAAIFRRLESTGAIPSARLVAAGTDRARVEAICREMGGSVAIAIDNCPHQVVLAGSPEEVDRVVSRLRDGGVFCEELPFARAYHTPGFATVIEPLDEFYRSLVLHPARVPVYSCATAERIPDSIAGIRRLAVAQWTRPVGFRVTIEAMYRDGLRVFVDVGARGNLCGYVEDILRGRPSYAVSANLPRRSGTNQLNHLVASLFAQGLPLDPSYLYARRRPAHIDLDAPPAPDRSCMRIEVGFPEMRLSESVISRLARRDRPASRPETLDHPEESGHRGGSVSPSWTPTNNHAHHPCEDGNGNGNGHDHGNTHTPADPFRELFTIPVESIASAGLPDLEPATLAAGRPEGRCDADEEVMLGFLETMNDFLRTQGEVVGAYLHASDAPSPATEDEPVDDSDPDLSSLRSGPEPGPWVGTIREWRPGRSIVTQYPLVAGGDPVAENHTLGGRHVSAIEPELKGLPVLPFTMMAEMVAQVGSLIVPPGLVLEGLRDVRALRWVQFESQGVLELRGECDSVDPRRVRVSLTLRKQGEDRLVFEGTAQYSERRSDSIDPEPFQLRDARPSKFTARGLYDEGWLFHGPPMQALTALGPISPDGFSGTITVLPLEGLLPPGRPAAFHTDPIVLDTFTHLLGCWGLDCLERGDVLFPLRMGRLSIRGPAPAVGTPIACRIRILEVERHCVRVDAELIRPDGRVWMHIGDWQDWRFDWPARYRDVFRAPDTVLIGEELPLAGIPLHDACAVWLAPPGDMARPVWRDVLEWIQLGPDERASHLALGGPEIRRSHRLWGRIAAKEAARRIWLARGLPPRYPADLALAADPAGSPILVDRDRSGDGAVAAVSIAHAEGVAVALAAHDPKARVGIDVEPVCGRETGFEARAFTVSERALLASWTGEARCEWIARLLAARQAAAKAGGMGPEAGSDETAVLGVDPETGLTRVELRARSAAACRELAGTILLVRTDRRGDHAWAWTLEERTER